jgi:SAM-dependent methyltransferase
MFFPERIKSIRPSDWVLDIGPGGSPHPRANVLLEYDFGSGSVSEAQRGYAPPLKTSKPVIFYKGNRFPFDDRAFDYVICSHVIEHVQDVTAFIAELNRVGKAGYLEYPTIYYDYVYNFPEHLTFVKRKGECLYWMNKSDSGLSYFQSVQNLFYESLRKHHYGLINDLQPYFFEGFEWQTPVRAVKTSRLDDLVFDQIDLPSKPDPRSRAQLLLARKVLSRFMKWSRTGSA